MFLPSILGSVGKLVGKGEFLEKILGLLLSYFSISRADDLEKFPPKVLGMRRVKHVKWFIKKKNKYKFRTFSAKESISLRSVEKRFKNFLQRDFRIFYKI